jgi:predicted transcriptional regulator
MDLRGARSVVGISQSKLARLSGVSRFKICMYELGDSALTTAEQSQIQETLKAEAERLRSVSRKVDFGLLELPLPRGRR